MHVFSMELLILAAKHIIVFWDMEPICVVNHDSASRVRISLLYTGVIFITTVGSIRRQIA